MNESIQVKQAYLRENVLEKAYDADEFMSFLQQKKGENGLDLNNWTMNELIKAVNEFIHDKDKENEPEEEINTNNLNKIDELEEEGDSPIVENETVNPVNENININTNTANENIIQENNNIIEQPKNEYLDFETCEKNETNSFSKIESIKIKLSSPQKIDGGIFSKSFISYVVSTEPLGYQTNKRYSDFSWLRKTLSLIYPNCVLPPLCKKNFGDRFSDTLISKRMRSIEKFMQGIIEHPLIKNSELINIFLSTKENEYKKKISKYQKIKKPTTLVKQIKTLDGIAKIGITNKKEIYLDNIKNYSRGNAYILQKITKSYKSLMNIMQQLSNKMKNISQLFKQLLDKSIKYYDSHNTSETFNIMSQFMNDWAKIQDNQIKIMNENIREYFRYVKNEFNYFNEMANKVKSCKNNYTKAKEKLLLTKENLFLKQEVELWQLNEEDKPNKLYLLKNKNLAFEKMLPKDTQKVENLKKYYGLMLNSLIDEFERIRKVNAKRHKLNITNFVRLQSSECTNLHVCLADRLSEFNQLKDDADIYNIDGGIQLKKVENIPDEGNHNINNTNNNDFDFEEIDYIDEKGNPQNNKKDNSKENMKKEEKKVEDKNEQKQKEIMENDKKIEEKKEEKKVEEKKEEKKIENKKEEKKNEEKKEEKKIEDKKEEKKIEDKKEEKKVEDKKEEKKAEDKKEEKKVEDKKEEKKIEDKKEDKKNEDKKEELKNEGKKEEIKKEEDKKIDDKKEDIKKDGEKKEEKKSNEDNKKEDEKKDKEKIEDEEKKI